MRYGLITILLLPLWVMAADFATDVRPVLAKYCLGCHNAQLITGGLDLTKASGEQDVAANRTLWTKLADRVDTGIMPPAGARPSQIEREAVVAWVRTALAGSVSAKGRALAFPRLTRVEYTNTVRDLLGVNVDFSRVLPEDSEGPSGFVNDRTSLLMTDALLDRYLEAAQLALDAAFAAVGPSKVMRFQAEGSYQAFQRKAPQEIAGVRGILLSGSRMTKYQNLEQQFSILAPGSYRLRVRARPEKAGLSGGLWFCVDRLDESQREAAILVEGDSLHTYETDLFLTHGDHRIFYGFDFDLVPWLPPAPQQPQRKMPPGKKDLEERLRKFRPPDVAWEQLSRLTGYAAPEPDRLKEAQDALAAANHAFLGDYFGDFEESRYQWDHGYLPLSMGDKSSLYKDSVSPAFAKLAQLTGIATQKLDALWESHCGPRLEENRAIFQQQYAAWQIGRDSRNAEVGNIFVDWIELEGPLPARLHGLSPDSPEKTIAAFAQRAFRRPLRAGEANRYVAQFRKECARGTAEREALRRSLVAILVSPHFLYRVENGSGRDLDSYAMASRLSYFLWATSPDNALYHAAEAGALMQPGELTRQLERMLDSPQTDLFARLFTEQWLDLTSIGRDRVPDGEFFREFSPHLAEDMRQEVALDFQDLVRRNGSVLELLDSRVTFLNERLARLYNVDGIRGSAFRRVELSDARRGGLLGTAAVLTSTSLPIRTSPVFRGKFVLEKILGQHLPPPPPDAGALPDDAGQNTTKTLRESFAAHRSKPVCGACHNSVDPVGFGLENFDFVGRWRTQDPGGTVDARGDLPDGTHFEGVTGLKKYLLERRADEFLRTLARNMMAYALGREVEADEEEIVRHIADVVKSDGYGTRRLLREMVLSKPFRQRPSSEDGGKP